MFCGKKDQYSSEGVCDRKVDLVSLVSLFLFGHRNLKVSYLSNSCLDSCNRRQFVIKSTKLSSYTRCDTVCLHGTCPFMVYIQFDSFRTSIYSFNKFFHSSHFSPGSRTGLLCNVFSSRDLRAQP